jgi:DNA-binding LytR/AlgR family response regulator
MPLRTVIIEDEVPSRERLKSLLADILEIELVGEAGNGSDGVKLIDTLRPDLAFLDIQLPEFTSFEILAKIRHQPLVVFITAYDVYAIKAFEANAVDYLLKPTTQERLVQAIERVRQRTLPNQDIRLILQSVLKSRQFRQRFTVKVGSEILFVPTEDIFWFHADDKYVFLHTAKDEFLLEETLKNLETCMDPETFLRIHKSVIVNMGKIRRVKRTFLGQYQVQMDDLLKSVFKIGRTYLPKVKEKLDL